ncbi:MAG: thrombospondin type 3 repeat-containing protein [Nannocystaceae bacterium]
MLRTFIGRRRLRVAAGLAGLAGLACLTLPAGVFAQVPLGPALRPAASAESHISTESSRVLSAWTPSASLLTAYDRWVVPQADDSQLPAFAYRATSYLLAALGLFDYAQIDFGLPLIVYQEGSVPSDATATGTEGLATLEPTAIGDLRAGLKGSVLRTPSRGFGLGVGFDVTFPTGSINALATEDGMTYTPAVYAENRTIRGIETAINIGYTVRPDVQVGSYVGGDALIYRLATRVPFGPNLVLAAVGELDGAVGIPDSAASPLVVRGGLRWRLRSGIVLGAYAGTAVVGAIHVPDVHGLASFGYVPRHRVGKERAFAGSPRPHATALARRYERAVALTRKPEPAPVRDPRDRDGDGILARADACPTVAEDLDNFEDEDGCPEWDNDRDGLRDGVDMCPNAPELINGYADWDGCPDVRTRDGRGRSMSKFDPRLVFPKVEFVHRSASLTPDAAASVSEFAELMHLNPWMGQLSIRIEVHADPNDDTTVALAKARGDAVTAFLRERGIDGWRLHVGKPALVPMERNERLRFALRDTTGGLRPVAPPAAVIDRWVTTAVARARVEADRKAAAARLAGPHGGDPPPAVDPAAADVMAQGPQDASKPVAEVGKEPDPGSARARVGSHEEGMKGDVGHGAEHAPEEIRSSERPTSQPDGSKSPAESARKKKSQGPAKKKRKKARPAAKQTPLSNRLLDLLHRTPQ